MSWRDRIAKLLMGKAEAPPVAAPRWPPELGPVDPLDPKAVTRMNVEGGVVLGEPYLWRPSRAQMNVNRGGPADVLSFEDRWPQ